jgi:hypothetical protein
MYRPSTYVGQPLILQFVTTYLTCFSFPERRRCRCSRIILKWILRIQNVRVWTGFIWITNHLSLVLPNGLFRFTDWNFARIFHVPYACSPLHPPRSPRFYHPKNRNKLWRVQTMTATHVSKVTVVPRFVSRFRLIGLIGYLVVRRRCISWWGYVTSNVWGRGVFRFVINGHRRQEKKSRCPRSKNRVSCAAWRWLTAPRELELSALFCSVWVWNLASH